MQNIEIRTARLDELAPMVALYNLMWRGKTPLSLKMARSFYEGLERNDNHNLFVAIVDDKPVAVFTLLIRENLDLSSPPDGIMENVAVHPEFQGRGIGKRIIGFATKCCEKAGCARLIHVSNEKREGAHSFYEAQGFTRHGYKFVRDLNR